MTHFWAKTTPDGKPGLSVYDHMINVGCVARCIAEISPELLERFHLRSSVVGALAGLHDLGKISPGFQRKCEAWLEENSLAKIARNGCWDTGMESDHGKISHASLQAFLSEAGIDRITAKFLSTVLGAHHGRLTPPNDRGYRPQGAISETNSGIDWEAERRVNAQNVWDHFAVGNASFSFPDTSASFWWLAGLASVADWIGSDERFFSAEGKQADEATSYLAQKALDAIGFRKVDFIRDLSFHDLFHDTEKPETQWIPNDMQEKAVAAIIGPGVYVIEAPMGMGKTEAALWAAYHLLVSGKVTGIYFALPTQATSNRMHLRMNEFVRRICINSDESRLIHSNSWLKKEVIGLSPIATIQDSKNDDARAGRDWFASSKRALIAPFGVGTVDQALLGVVAAKHFFVRHFALAGKVVILDEVHSYDLYTGTLIDRLVETLEGLGCTVIVLSATLTGKRRRQIVAGAEPVTDEVELSYPLITGRMEKNLIKPVAATVPQPRTVKVDFVAADAAAQEAIALAQNGGTVIWICDTVDAAQKQYRGFMRLTPGSFPLGLLHSRFPFWRREEIESEWMERLGKTGSRCGSILVSTQIVEQSVDLDADLMISELAPTDMLLQRLGRLWRHERGQRPVKTARFCIIKETQSIEDFRHMEPKAIVETLGGKAHVYDPYVLLRSLQLWGNCSILVLPTQVRELIETTYNVRDDDPKSWEKLFDERFVQNSNERFKAAMNSNYWQPQLPDAEGVQTRLNEQQTISVVLCRKIDKQKVVFIDGTTARFDGDEFRLSTAQAIHKNLVKVPDYCFETGGIEPCPAFTVYLFGMQSAAIVTENGAVKTKGLKNETRLFYSNEMGLVIEKSS